MAPHAVPEPPSSKQPPITVAAIASNSIAVAVVVETEFRLHAVITPASPARTAQIMKARVLIRPAGTPLAVAASTAPPTA